MKIKSAILVAAGVAGTALLASLFSSQAGAKYEEPNWKSIKKEKEFEIRQYPELISASVTVSGSNNNEQANKAFRILAGYIFGNNVPKQKIAMTVPVTEKIDSEEIAMTAPVVQSVSKNTMTMKFFMPSQYKLDSLPEAKDKRIEFEVIPACTFATIRFSGIADTQSVNRETKKLQDYLKTNKLMPIDKPILAVYNPPWTLPFLRRNEIWIAIDSPTTSVD